MHLRSPFARLTLCAALAWVASQPAFATWSIVVVNTKTREVCVATATCLEGIDIQKAVPVLVPGVGGGASQSLLDSGGINRRVIYRGLIEGLTPDQILAQLATLGGYQARQFGIVNLDDDPVTFTGNNAGAAKGGVSGTVGDLRYAIQGNVLTGPEVWLGAEHALLGTEGDLSQKVMAAMQAAYAWGGDGRCSCSPSAPTSCGAPPPSFTKSAHVGTIVLARIGDRLGTCNGVVGCASGTYYLNLNFIGDASDPDPVRALWQQYQVWRAGQLGRADQVHSVVEATAQVLPADGAATAEFLVRLFDLEGNKITQGGHQILPENLSDQSPVTQVLSVVDHGNGDYTVRMLAGTNPGMDLWRIRVADAMGSIALQPDLPLRVDPPSELVSGYYQVSAHKAQSVPLWLDFGTGAAGSRYLVLGGASGTSPGHPLLGVNVPLNPDGLLRWSFSFPNQAPFLGSLGQLGGEGRARARFDASAELLAALVGSKVDFVALRFDPAPQLSPTSGFLVVP
jgi:hypothetical protein